MAADLVLICSINWSSNSTTLSLSVVSDIYLAEASSHPSISVFNISVFSSKAFWFLANESLAFFKVSTVVSIKFLVLAIFDSKAIFSEVN